MTRDVVVVVVGRDGVTPTVDDASTTLAASSSFDNSKRWED